jgi:hypothetical protein
MPRDRLSLGRYVDRRPRRYTRRGLFYVGRARAAVASRMQAIKHIGWRAGAGSLPNDGSVESVFLRLHFLHGRRDGRDTFFRANKPKARDQGLVALFSRLFARYLNHDGLPSPLPIF